MWRLLLASVVLAAALLLPWQGMAEPVEAAAGGLVVTRAAARPARAAAGTDIAIGTNILARSAGVVDVVAEIQAPDGQVVWEQRWAAEVFARRQTRIYRADWTAPATLPAGRYRVVIRLVNSQGREVSRRRTAPLVLTAAVGAAPVLPLPPPPPTPTPAPTPVTSPAPPSYPFAITGSATFAANIRAGLERMRDVSPDDYVVIAGNVTEIREGPQNYAWGGSRAIQISATSAGHSAGYAGSIVLHEAVHVRNWFANDQPVFGCDGEAKSLRAQAAYLRRAGEVALATWVEGLVGTWC